MIRFRLACCLALLFVSGCSKSDRAVAPPVPPESTDARPTPGDWITYCLLDEPDSLNPITEQLEVAYTVVQYLSEALVTRNPVTYEILPCLAESWEISPDKLKYTFHLRHGVTWSDGQPFTAADVKFSLAQVLDPKTISNIGFYFSTIKSYEATDPYTVVITTTKPYYRLLESFSNVYMVPAHAFKPGFEFNTDPFGRHPIGTGPYKFVRWVAGSQIVLERRDDYWGAKAFPKRILFQLIEEPSTALQLLKKGEIDVIDGISPLRYSLELLHSSSLARLNVYNYVQPAYYYVGFNLRRPLFSDVRVRHAIDLLMPRQRIQKLGGGPEFEQEVSGYDLPTSPRYDASILPTPEDPALSARLLDEAGWKLSPRDGFRYRDGKPLEFTLVYPSGGQATVEEMIEESLLRGGVHVHLDSMDAPRLNDALNRWDFDAFYWGEVFDLDDDPYAVWHSSQALIHSGSNTVGYQSRTADRLIEAGQLEFDPDKRYAIYRQLHRVLHDDYPVCFLYTAKTIMLINKRVHDVPTEQLGFLPFLSQTYIPLGQQRHRDQ